MTNKKPHVLLLGPDLNKKKPGGIVSVIQVHLASGLAKRYQLSSQVLDYEGSMFNKIKLLFHQLGHIRRVAHQAHYDLVHVHASLYQSAVLRLVFVLWLKRWTTAPFLLQFHGGLVAHIRYFKGLFKRQLKQFAHILVLTDAQKEGLILLGVSKEKIELVPNYELGTVDTIERTINSKDQPMRILFLGRMIKEKGIFELVEAVSKIAANFQDEIEVIMAGEGPALPKLRNTIQQHGLEKMIRLPGYVAGDEKKKLLKVASIFVLPSYNEGFPMSILEAMNYEQAIIATNRGQTKELLQGNNGILLANEDPAQLANALSELIANPDRVVAMGKASKHLFDEKFTMEGKGEAHFSSIYDQLIV